MGNVCPCHDCPVREAGIFSSFCNEDLLCVRDLTHQNFYKKRQIIFHEENPCQGFYIIRSGRVKLTKSSRTGRQQIIKLVNPAGVMGEDAVFDNAPHPSTAEALEDSEVCLINKGEFLRFLRERPDLAIRIMSVLSGELREARSQVIDMALKDARERMACLILCLANRYGIERDRHLLLDLHLTRSEMAEMIGIAQETAIRLLSEFKENGLIKTNGRQITILDLDGVGMVAGGE
jgi:CRP/FNR family transcriptional regulator